MYRAYAYIPALRSELAHIVELTRVLTSAHTYPKRICLPHVLHMYAPQQRIERELSLPPKHTAELSLFVCVNGLQLPARQTFTCCTHAQHLWHGHNASLMPLPHGVTHRTACVVAQATNGSMVYASGGHSFRKYRRQCKDLLHMGCDCWFTFRRCCLSTKACDSCRIQHVSTDVTITDLPRLYSLQRTLDLAFKHLTITPTGHRATACMLPPTHEPC